jgi:hypothetical protein
MGENGPHGERVEDGGDDAQPAATPGTGQDIEVEHAAHQRRPGPGARGVGGAGAGLELARIAITGGRSCRPCSSVRSAPAAPTSASSGPRDRGKDLAMLIVDAQVHIWSSGKPPPALSAR